MCCRIHRMEDLAIDTRDEMENDEGLREPTISEVKPCSAEVIREVNRQKTCCPSYLHLE